MVKIVSVSSMRRIEAEADSSGITYAAMMENAGYATALRILKHLEKQPQARLTILVGPGNKGGDGLVTGRIIAEQSEALVRFYLLQQRPADDPHLKAVREKGLLIATADDDQRYRVLHHLVRSTDILVDALFGIGVRLPLRDNAAELLRHVHQALREQDEPEGISVNEPAAPQRANSHFRPRIIAVDCPSGLDCDSGELDKNTLFADETVTYIAAKPGLLTFPGAQAVGRLFVSTIGVPQTLSSLQAEHCTLADHTRIRALLPARSANAHKGSTGRALITAGSEHYFGAPALAAHAAYRSGAGLVTVATSQAIIQALAGTLPEVTWLPLDLASAAAAQLLLDTAAASKAWLIGPGWGQSEPTRHLFNNLLEQIPPDNPPLIIDADGLNLLAENERWWERLPPNTILTPHPGEMARLANITTAQVQAQRWQLAQEKAQEWQVILVLKGAHTLIAAPNGRVTALPFKTDALATAGTGDVLAGMIVGLAAQGAIPYHAAVCGAWLHGLAGVIAAEQHGSTRSVIAGDVIQALGAAFNRLEQTQL